eukprot:4052966-Alexandrium_andersonii.AAC.1
MGSSCQARGRPVARAKRAPNTLGPIGHGVVLALGHARRSSGLLRSRVPGRSVPRTARRPGHRRQATAGWKREQKKIHRLARDAQIQGRHQERV